MDGDLNNNELGNVFAAHLIEVSELTPLGWVAFSLTTPFCAVDRVHKFPEQPIVAAPYRALTTLAKSRAVIQEARALKVAIRCVGPSKHSVRIKQMLAAFMNVRKNRPALIRTLLANDVMSQPSRDLYGGMVGQSTWKQRAIDDALDWNDEQRQIIAKAHDAPGGILCVRGAGGTGKSAAMRAAMLPLLNIPQKSSKNPFKALYCLPQNETVDYYVRKLDEENVRYRHKRNLPGRRIFVRAHDPATARAQFEVPFRPSPKDDQRPPIRLTDDELSDDVRENLAQCAGASRWYRAAKNHFNRAFGVSDRTLRKLRFSLGWWIAVLGGFSDDSVEGITPQSQLFEHLRELLKQVANGQEFDSVQKGQLTEDVMKLLRYVLEMASGVVCTYSRAADPKIYSGFAANTGVLEEAGRSHDAEAL